MGLKDICVVLAKCISVLVALVLMIACKSASSDKVVGDIINSWIDKEIIFPQNLLFMELKRDTFDSQRLLEQNYKILTYIDSTGCTICKLKLYEWKKTIAEMNSAANSSVPVLFVMCPKDRQELEYLFEREQFNYPVFIDENDSLNQLNHFSNDAKFQTFLLDKNNKVVAIGNPTNNPKVKELYLKLILGDKAPKRETKLQTDIKVDEMLVNMGSFDWQKEQHTVFAFTNTGMHPLVIVDVSTSCGCTSVEYSKEPIAPGRDVKIKVAYKADHPEHFDKKITVHCNISNSPVELRITGDAQ